MTKKKVVATILASALLANPVNQPSIFANTTIKNIHVQKINSRSGTEIFNIQRREFDLPEDLENFGIDRTVPMLSDWSGISFDGTEGGIYEISYFVKNTVNIVKVVHRLETNGNKQHVVKTTITNSGDARLIDFDPTYTPYMHRGEDPDRGPKNFPTYSIYNSNLNRYDEYFIPDGYLDDDDGNPTIDLKFQDTIDDPATPDVDESTLPGAIKDDVFVLQPKEEAGVIEQTIDMTSKFMADYGRNIKLTGSGNDLNFKYMFEEIGKGEFTFHLTTSGVDLGTIVNFEVKEINAATDEVAKDENLQILEEIANFTGTPTHYMLATDENGDNIIVDDDEIASPQVAGDRPGFDITFDHPIDIIKLTAEDIATGDYPEYEENDYIERLMPHGRELEAQLNVKSYDGDNIQLFVDFATDYMEGETIPNIDPDKNHPPIKTSLVTIHNSEEIGTKEYIPPSLTEQKDGVIAGKHKIKIVQNDEFFPEISECIPGQGDVTKVDDYVKWSELTNSELMELVEITILDDKHIPEGEFVSENRFLNRVYGKTGSMYTFMEYRVERVSISDAIITYIPYRGLADSTKYLVYDSKDTEAANLVGTGYGYVSDSIPVPIMTSGKQGYIVEIVVSDQTELISQYLEYDADIDKNIKPPTPMIDSVENIYVVPPEETGGQAQAVGFDITFTAPKNTESNPQLDQFIDEGVLYYEFLMYDQEDTPEDRRIFSKVFKVERGDDVENSDGVMEPGPVEISSYSGKIGDASYRQSTESFTVEDIIIKERTNDEWNRLQDEVFEDDEYLKSEDYPLQEDIVEMDNLRFPEWQEGNTYYYTLRAIYDRDPSNDEYESSTLTFSNESNPVAITFTNKNEILPIVTIINDEPQIYDDPNGEAKANQDVSFNVVNLEKYVDFMLDPIEWVYKYTMEDNPAEDTNSNNYKYYRTYEMFLHQVDEPELEEFDKAQTIDTNNIRKVTDINWEIDMDDYIKDLRDGEIVKIEFEDNRNFAPTALWPLMELKGLDQNQTYYVRLRVKVESGDNDMPPKLSSLSKVHTFTTHLDPTGPTPEEQKPPTPADLWIEEQDSNTSVKLAWDEPNYEVSKEQELYYELIRTENAELPKEILDSSLSIEEVLKEDPTLLGFVTGGHLTEENFIYSVIYNGRDIVTRLLDPRQHSSVLSLEDDTLTPNKIYYYYLRTVVIIEGMTVSSDWINQPVTTAPIDPPTQLKVEKVKNYEYLPTDEVVVSFMAPIPTDAAIPNDYDFEIAIKGAEDNNFSFANNGKYSAERITPNEDAPTPPEGYQYYVYKISGFESSTRYDIKVRIVDYRTEVSEDEEQPRSLYTDTASYQTEVDEEDQEDESRLEEFLAKYDRLVMELKGQQYWSMLETEDTGIYKYKESYLRDSLSSNIFELNTKDDFTTVEYYFPASAFEDGHEATLTAELDNFVATIRPDTIYQHLDEIKDATRDIKSNKIEDFYIKIALYTRELDKVNGEEALTDEFNIELDVVHLDKEDIYIEADILGEIVDLIEDGRIDVEEELEELLKDDTVEDDELLEIVELEVDNIKTRYQDKAYEEVQDSIIRTKEITELETSILLKADVESADATVYYYDRGWKEDFAFRMLDNWAVEFKKPGSYVFSGTEEKIGIEIQTQSQDQEALNRYNLDTIFTTKLGPNGTSSKEQLYTAIATILGAQQGTNLTTFLSQQGFKGVTGVNMTGSVRQDDAIYMLMQLYEKIHFTDVSNIFITNRQSIKNIGAFNPTYREYIYAAVELGFIETVNGQVYPSMPLNPDELSKILAKIVTK
ncbi:hypothetical protein AN641_05315 [Candidatus Epulonipiscioides gigas]|nr:hypothetical protein AN641_05315 [Epulopiscium sp. SCG-C07WGA-EpuloA2]